VDGPTEVKLELDDIQRGVLSPRPTPYAATYLLFRIDDRAQGRELMRRASAVVTSAADSVSPLGPTWVSVAVTCAGLAALGVPPSSLDTFAWEFRQGMAARAKALGDVGASSPENWEAPLGSPDVDVVITAVAPDPLLLEAAVDRARPAYDRLPGVTAVWRQDCYALPTETEHFGYRDGVSHPAIEGSGIPGSNGLEVPLKAGEFILGYPDELGGIQTPQPDVLGRNGSYAVFRKLHQRVADFRR
jgi:deferrochelatase/peroxidase EfeB